MEIPPLTAPQPYSHSVQLNVDEIYLTKRKLRKKFDIKVNYLQN